MATDDFQTLLIQNSSPDMVPVSVKGQLAHTVYTEKGFRTPGDFITASSPGGHTMLNTVIVKFIAEEEKLPADFISSVLPIGSKEYYTVQAGLR